MKTRFVPVILTVAFTACAVQGATREEIRAEVLRQADGVHRKVSLPNPAYGCRELFTAMLAYAYAGTNLTRIAELLPLAEGLQDTDPESRAYGNFRWYLRDAAVADFNAVDFCMQHGALLWTFHKDRLDPATRERFLHVLKLGLHGLIKHRPRETYTNIAILNASDLILLGEALGDAGAVQEGERRLTSFLRTIYDDGIHEFVSPTYYAVNVECLMLLAEICPHERVREMADALLHYFWTDIALNYFAPSQRLGGSHSRTYDYAFGFGGLDHLLVHHGWLAPPKGYRPGVGFAPLYSGWAPPETLRTLNAVYPRLVEQTWGNEPFCARTLYACEDIAIGTSWRKYHGRMDIPLAVDFPAPSRDARQPRVSFIPDGRRDPYGINKISDGKTHSKAFHMDSYWASAQDKGDALAVAVYRERDFVDTTGTLESHLIMPHAIETVWVNDAPLTLAATNAIPLGAAVFLRHGSAALGIRIPWSRGQDATPCTLALVAETNTLNVMRLTLTHSRLPDSPTQHAGVAYRLRAGSKLDDEQFRQFRQAFMAEQIGAVATDDGIALTAAGGRLTIRADAPYTKDPVVSPLPPRTMLALNGMEMGQAALRTLPAIRERLAHNASVTPVPVAADKPTVWEAVNAKLSCVFEVATDDPAASNGRYLWEPEYDGIQMSGTGRAVYALDVAKAGGYTLAGRVLSPTPDDDSFFVRIATEDGRDLLPEEAWHLGVRKEWGWTDLKRGGAKITIPLPQGRVHLILRSREAGTKITQLRLTPPPPADAK
ncbi:MAG: hypothetical protein FWG50_00505 [Kiritimatiellaeota bacterium]|nr:hypothetical protein [Kiritimatiellota bacterium]